MDYKQAGWLKLDDIKVLDACILLEKGLHGLVNGSEMLAEGANAEH